MRATIRLILRDPTLRLMAFCAAVLGCWAGSVGPYASLIAVEVFGISNAAYAAVLVAALAISVGASVWIGILTDQHPHRRAMALTASLTTLAAGGIVLIWPGQLAFVLSHTLLMPLAGTIMGQFFAVARLKSQTLDPDQRDSVTALIRTCIAIPFVVVLPLWGVLAENGGSLLAIYGGVTGFGLILTAAVWRYWPADDRAPWVEVKSGIGFRASLAEMAKGPVFLRVQLFGMLHVGGAMIGIITGLVFAQAGRGTDQVGLFFAIFVAFEVASIVLIAPLRRHFRRLTLITVGVLTYAAAIALLPLWVDSALVWLLVIPAGVGGGLIYNLAVGYLQDLLGARPGAGASLLVLQRIATDSFAAAAFWIGTLISGYGLAAALAAACMALAMAAILALDRVRVAAA